MKKAVVILKKATAVLIISAGIFSLATLGVKLMDFNSQSSHFNATHRVCFDDIFQLYERRLVH